MLLLLSHLSFNVLSLPGFISSLTSIITNTHFSHFSNVLCFCYPELFFIPLLLLQVHFLFSLAVNCTIFSIAFRSFHSLINFYCYTISSFLTSSLDFFGFLVCLGFLGVCIFFNSLTTCSDPCPCTLAFCPSLH